MAGGIIAKSRIKATVARLPGDNPVNVGVVVHADADWRVYVHVAVAT